MKRTIRIVAALALAGSLVALGDTEAAAYTYRNPWWQ